MKVLLSWLREFAPIEGAPSEIAEELDDLGLAVEEMVTLGEGLEDVVVARVLECRPHPDADRVQLVDVDAGDGEPRQVVCGAFNMRQGDLVPLATVGTTLPGGLTIERRKMRGEWSNGMLCAPDELELGEDHSGILILDPSLEPGTSLPEALGLAGDVLYDLEVNPNRPDAMSMVGVARDLAARLGVPFRLPGPAPEETGEAAEAVAGVEILDPDLCGRFVARVMRGVGVGSSPLWMANRLRAAGMRPINRIVDVSNYVMLELGQPNHTYDLDLVPEGRLATRWARDGERLVTLDGFERELTAGDGVIVDASDTPIGLAGVMGGASTEISDATDAVLLEAAWWDPMAIARTSSRLGLRSEASMRFERGVDPEITELAAARFCELLASTGEARVLEGAVEARGELPERTPVRVRTARVNSVLGTELGPEAIRSHLEPIGFVCTPVDGDHDVAIPSFRPDSDAEIDVIEEVARHHGYSRIPQTVPKAHAGHLSDRQRTRRELREILRGMGIDEAMPMPFLAPGDLERAGCNTDAVVVTNPLDANESVLRTSLRPGLLRALAYNASHRILGVRLFEMGTVFERPQGADVLPVEHEQVAVVLGGEDAVAATRAWHVVREALGLDLVELAPREPAGLHPTRTGVLAVEGEQLGVVGEVDPQVLESFEVPGRVGWLELDLDVLVAQPHGDRTYHPVSTYPSSDIDLAFEVPESIPAAAIADTIRAASDGLLAHLELFDVYRGDQVAPGTRSLAYRLRLQAHDRTLTDGEVHAVRAEVIDAVRSAYDVSLRT